MDDEELRFAAGAIVDADTVVAMSGAGVSTVSGLPDFRSAGGLWERYEMEDLHLSRFRTDPESFWRTYVQISAMVCLVNPGEEIHTRSKRSCIMTDCVSRSARPLTDDPGLGPYFLNREK